MKDTHLRLLALSLLTLSQCKKDDYNPQLPPETTTGAYTFGCKVDGQVFVPRDGRGKPGLDGVEYVKGTGRGGYYLNLGATDWHAVNGIALHADSLLFETGKTYLFKPGKGHAQAIANYDNNNFDEFDTDSGQLVITRYDSIERILAGRFDFVATNRYTGKQLHVTDGRFDVVF